MTSTMEAPAPATAPVVVTTQPRSNLIGLIALGLAILGFIFAAFLLTAGIAWMLLIPALILGAVGLFLPDRRKGSALAAVVVAIVGLILSLVGFRLPLDLTSQTNVINNDGVNPFSNLAGGVLGVGGGANGAPGSTGAQSGTGVGVEVASVDCHTPLATVTGLNLTGEVCAISVSVTNNGNAPISIDSSGITATVGGTGYTADEQLAEGNVLSAQVGVGESVAGTVYVNVPSGTVDLDALTVDLGTGADALVTVDLGN